VDAAVAKWLGSSFGSVLNLGLKDELRQSMGLKDTEDIPGTITVTHTPSSAMLTVVVEAEKEKDADGIMDAFLELYPSYVTKSVGTLELTVFDKRTAGDIGVEEFALWKQIGLAVLAGAVLCIGLLVIYALTRKTVRRDTDMERITNISCLGHIPMSQQKKRGENSENRIILTNKRLDRRYKQEIYALQAKVERRMKKDSTKSIMVTSSIAGEGKTTTAVNLALAMSEKKNVILIDGDYRKPSVVSLLKLKEDNRPGLFEYLYGKANWEGIKRKIVNKNLTIIQMGKSKGRLADLLTDQKIQQIRDCIAQEDAYIIIDTPPAALFADAALFSAFADHGLYVVRQDVVPEGVVREGLEQITGQSDFVLGYAFNYVKTVTIGYGSYHYGSYGSYGNYKGYSRQ
jgi:receptor protein-tyrosine kinase